MSEPVARQRPSVDLDDFERRLRQAQTQANQSNVFPGGPTGHEDDPLTELARLVGGQPDPYNDVFAREAVRPVRQEPGLRDPALPPPTSPRLSGDFAAIEAGLRGTYPGDSPMRRAPEPQLYADHDESHYADPQGEPDWRDTALSPPPPKRARRPVYAMIATIAVGVIGIGVAFAYKGTGSSPREIKTIMAAAGPSKVQPPVDTTANQDSPDAGALGKGQDAPTKLVSREEQPVDLSQAVRDNARLAAAQGRGDGASSVDVPLSPGQAQGRSPGPTASPDYSALMGAGVGTQTPDSAASQSSDQGFGIGMPSPKKVKVVSVRPDGTILSSRNDTSADAPEAPMPAAPAAPPVHPTKATKAAKSTSRVTSTKPVDIASAAAAGDDAPKTETPKAPTPKVAKVKKPKPKPKPQNVASAETDNQDTANAAPAASDTVASGGFAVQLAAPGSEAEAKSVSSKLGAKYADALSGRHLGYRKAESNGKSIYRVRVGGMSREDATSLCAKLKGDGGACFIAKN